jgi:hypothetical protein
MYMIENIRATMKRLKLDGPGFGGGLSLELCRRGALNGGTSDFNSPAPQ